MTKIYDLVLHVFRRDLRTFDNNALYEAQQCAQFVLPVFIFDPRQIANNSYKSKWSIGFMLESLEVLEQTIHAHAGKLFYFYGESETVIEKLLHDLPIEAVFLNRDYTPFSMLRDKKIDAICHKHKVDFHSFRDCLLNEPEQILKKDGSPYTIFTYAQKAAAHLPVVTPQTKVFKNYYIKPIDFADQLGCERIRQLLAIPNSDMAGGRKQGLKLISEIKLLSNYEQNRNYPALNGTSKLSAHLKFGTVSVREVFHAIKKLFGNHHLLIKELYWRDFFTHIGFHFPHVFQRAFVEKYANIQWSIDTDRFQLWCEGKTGFPFVDAGMRELNSTGFMHNRLRMVTASFLVKDLHINWQWGEKYFAQNLIDYDPAVNNGNWQWAASTGCDAQPYFRIFNPWLQQKKFDAECEYIKKWLPELKDYPAQAIHNFGKSIAYLTPVVDHAEASTIAKKLFKNC